MRIKRLLYYAIVLRRCRNFYPNFSADKNIQGEVLRYRICCSQFSAADEALNTEVCKVAAIGSLILRDTTPQVCI